MTWRIDPSIVAMAAAAALAAAALGGIWWLWWRLPKRQTARLGLTEPKDRADVEDNFRKTFTQLIGGAAVLIGAGFAYLQFQQQREQFQEQQRAAQDLLISNQVAKGFELLGNKEKHPAARRHLCARGRDEHIRAVSSGRSRSAERIRARRHQNR